MNNYETYRRAIAGLPLPLAYVDLDLLDENIEALLQRSGSEKTIRLASKSLRCPWVMRYILAASLQFQGLMCYHIREAVWLSRDQGFDDLLIAYPSMYEPDLLAMAEEVQRGKRLYLMVDRLEHLALADKVGQAKGIKFPICLDLDLSSSHFFGKLHFGVRRSSVDDKASLEAFIKAYQTYQNLDLVGLMGYEAQIAGLGEKVPGKALVNAVVKRLKPLSIEKLRQRRAEAVARLRQALNIPLPLVNGGGTGSLETTREEACVTELTIGSGFYAPRLFDFYEQFKHRPAAGFALEIVRNPKPGIYTCAGGGYVASGSPGEEKIPLPYLPADAKLDPNEMAGEVQTPVYSQQTLNLGDPVFFRHAKAGELCERFNQVQLLRQGKVQEAVPTYRGLGQCFL